MNGPRRSRSPMTSRSPLRPALLALAAASAACVMVPRPAPVLGLPPDDPGAPFSAVWVGHATVLMRFGGITLLTDPNLSDRILVLPRAVGPSLTPEQLPPVDVVVLSHLHMDHFDAPTLRRLGPGPVVLLPGEGAGYLDDVPQADARPVADWQTVVVRGLRVTAVPARHTGGRYGFDFLWNKAYAGWVIQGAGRTVYFAGDTGYDRELFREIGRRFPGIDVAFIPIAPSRNDTLESHDRWGHVGPNLALHILEDVDARVMVPIHFEAFYGRPGQLDQPRQQVTRLAHERGLDARLLALRPGERVMVDDERVRAVDAELVAEVRAGRASVRQARVALAGSKGAAR